MIAFSAALWETLEAFTQMKAFSAVLGPLEHFEREFAGIGCTKIAAI